MGSIALKHVLRPLKDSLRDAGVNIETANVSIGSSFTQVKFATKGGDTLMRIKVDCRDLEGQDKRLIQELYDLLFYLDRNWLGLRKEEIEFLEELRDTSYLQKLYTGAVSDLIIQLEELGVIELHSAEEGWLVMLKQRGLVALELLEECKLFAHNTGG